MEDLITGKVVQEQKSSYLVDAEGACYTAVLKGRIKKGVSRIYPGDNVMIQPFSERGESVIRDVCNRKNLLDKPAVANIDQVLYVTTFSEPCVPSVTTDRFLVNCKHRGIECVIIYNKMDLFDDKVRSDAECSARVYSEMGYSIIFSSAFTMAGMDEIKAACSGKVSVFAGVSGVGKSCIMKALFPKRDFKTSSLSRKLGRGRHTTTHTSLLKYKEKAYIADTPGFSFVGLPDISGCELDSYFPEIARFSCGCRFRDCSHTVEPGCEVKEAFGKGLITESRFKSYSMFYNEISGKSSVKGDFY